MDTNPVVVAPGSAPDPVRTWNALHQACPTRQLLSRVGEAWTMLVVSALAPHDHLRFSELRRTIEGVTQKMLTQTLRALERDGIVTRTVHPTVPVTVEYALTPMGRSLAETIGVVRDWAYAHMTQIQDARRYYDERVEGERAAAERVAAG